MMPTIQDYDLFTTTNTAQFLASNQARRISPGHLTQTDHKDGDLCVFDRC